jgi:hypothetical protein
LGGGCFVCVEGRLSEKKKNTPPAPIDFFKRASFERSEKQPVNREN